MNNKDCEINWNCSLPDSLKHALISTATIREGTSGLEITNKFSKMPGVFYILSGSLGICFSTSDMKNISGAVVGRGDWIGPLSIYGDSELYAIAEQIEPVRLLFFPKQTIYKLTNLHPEVYQWLYFCGQKSQSLWMQALLSSIHSREQKVVYAIVSLVTYSKYFKGTKLCINISQSQLAMITGISRPRLNEALKILEFKGFISIQRGKIYIDHLQELCKIMDGMNLMFHDPRALIER
ncbi:Crp/Fnr family transcriptional regulator [Vibrio hangzhouensis]|uniref:cAMP-binding domain of CRP or a regulatory subunit of cAMP-dependent protein kinases n=1 Tax=Vibrio hangzhouensis TaxID=462991 RepID=A0A1H5WY93_9VIBR|nr:Crp/Fnr family transcriptional regulator [Vibrio hangzhouensis]SEG04263.1 cAMP-binding domain of CRP or a regulatory subunit of cAMP-dependent protein kinases [Vibrio hangzhouensis]